MYKVLMIEDDAMIGDMVTMYLKEEGFHVIREANGVKGLQHTAIPTRSYFAGLGAARYGRSSDLSSSS